MGDGQAVERFFNGLVIVLECILSAIGARRVSENPMHFGVGHRKSQEGSSEISQRHPVYV